MFHYGFAPTASRPMQETKLRRINLIQDGLVASKPLWSSPDDSLLRTLRIRRDRSGSDVNSKGAELVLPLHQKETFMDLRNQQNWVHYAQQRKLEEAIKAYSQAIQIDPKFIRAYIARGCVHTWKDTH
ncbi:hypothetical protein BGW38_010958 [Lunasporangiospora selenospora]|uniref:Tetratricopeptide repeat-containing protein n=1 Tax=Lunasporangiospora selenospora TaxID=979761 RepID=A0A9P6FW65_9FUNG|nr:hypothetical protein BGW38_010958 [Lunasporangiospora selenospora]